MSGRAGKEDGLSLIELIVVVVILGLLGIVIATIFINTWKAQEAVRTQTLATTRGQLVASEIERAMRNATDFDVSDDGKTLEVVTALTESSGTRNRECQAFSFQSDGVHMSVGAAPGASAWALWQGDISTGSFSVTGNAVTYDFLALSKSGGVVAAAPVHFAGTTYMRSTNTATGSLSPCW